jgi:anaerobic selenocysteine-containing dehydrogenase
MKVLSSACPLNCWDNCGFNVTVDQGKVVQIEGNPEHPITNGKICGRGRMLVERTNSKGRLLFPLKKIDGEFTRISWEQALDEIAEKMQALKSEHGTTSILHSHDYANSGLLTNLDQRFFNCFGGLTEIIGSVCWGAGIEAQRLDFGTSNSHAPDDLFKSRNIIIWGRNVTRTNMHLYQNLLLAKRKGIKLIVIDPIYNATAKLADHYFSVKPGMDGFLAAGIIKEIMRLGLQASDFIEQHTNGCSDFQSALEDISLEEISRISEVEIDTITELAELYANGPTSTIMGLGMQRYENGGNTIRLIDALVAISGNIGISGGGANYANKQVGKSFNHEGLTLASREKVTRQFTMMKQAEKILTAKDPEIKMIIVTCGNPLSQVPDTAKVREAFASVETLVVIDQFMTDTALLADYVLPTTTAFEVEDIYYSSMYHHFVNYAPKLVEPPGECQSDLWIWTELAKRLGFGQEFAFTREEFLKIGLESLQDEGITLDKIKTEQFTELPVEKVPWQDYQFETPSGKFEFTSQPPKLPAESKWNNEKLAAKYPYTLLTIHPLRSNHSQHFHILTPEPKLKVEVSENIATKLGLSNNDQVRVWNDRGEVIGFVVILKQAHPDTINIDEGMESKFGGSVNKLTSSLVSDNGLGSTIYDCLVNIELKRE